MPARVVVVSGPDKGREIEIEARVVTVGSHPGSEINLQGQADTVATLRFRDGAYSVFNRGDESLELAGQEIPRDGKAHWKNGHDLVLPRGAVLKLRIQGNPEPTRVLAVANDSAAADLDEPEDYLDGDPDETQVPKKSQTTEMAVIAVCVLVCAWLLVSDESVNTSTKDVRKEYHDIVLALLRPENRPSSTDPGTRPDLVLSPRLQELVKNAGTDDFVLFDGIRDLIQSARVAEIRGDRKLAISKYQLARDKLLDRIRGGAKSQQNDVPRAEGDGGRSTIYHEVLNHVQYQLGVLSG